MQDHRHWASMVANTANTAFGTCAGAGCPCSSGTTADFACHLIEARLALLESFSPLQLLLDLKFLTSNDFGLADPSSSVCSVKLVLDSLLCSIDCIALIVLILVALTHLHYCFCTRRSRTLLLPIYTLTFPEYSD